MTGPVRFQRLREIVLTAHSLPPEEREHYLSSACRDDPLLRDSVESLLKQEREDLLKSGILDDLLGEACRAAPEEASAMPQVSGYLLFGRLGSGGLADVYEACQLATGQRVALKVLRTPPADHVRAHLFEREVRALAILSHPAIAALHDAGRTVDGRSFLAMELVRGSTLDRFVDGLEGGPGKRGSARARLEIFLQICDAVAYAHSWGVIHRDLKPSNILVTPAAGEDTRQIPQVKIVDFGLARIVDEQHGGMTTSTDLGQIRGTLGYMSPEQTRAIPSQVDVRSDVYSLGVLLYEMLTGSTPYELTGKSILEAIRTICDVEPLQPRVIRPMEVDLEAVILKALEKDPGRRYQTVAEMAEDLRRYLERRPVLARMPGPADRLWKAVRRHKGPFAAAAVLFLTTLGYGVTMSILFRAEQSERVRSDSEARKSKETVEFLQEMLASPDPHKMGKDTTIREMLDRAGGGLASRFADAPDVRASVEMTIGDTYTGLGEYRPAGEHLERSLEIADSLVPDDPALRAKALIRLARLAIARDANQEALRYGLAAVEAARMLPPDQGLVLAEALCRLGFAHIRLNHMQSGQQCFSEGLEISKRLAGPDAPLSLGLRTRFAWGKGYLGDEAGGLALLWDNLRRTRRIYGEEHARTADALNNLAGFYRGIAENPRTATADTLRLVDSLFTETLRIMKNVYGERHPTYIEAFRSWSWLYHLRNLDLGRGERMAREYLDLTRKAFPPRDWHIALAETSLASVLREQGRSAEARSHISWAPDTLWRARASTVGAPGFAARVADEIYSDLGEDDRAAPWALRRLTEDPSTPRASLTTASQLDPLRVPLSASPPATWFEERTDGGLWGVQATGSELRISKGPDPGTDEEDAIRGGLSSVFLLDGDFSVTVSYELADFESDPGAPDGIVRAALGAFDENGDGLEICRWSRAGRQGTEVRVEPKPDSIRSIGSHPTLPQLRRSGRLRIIRAGDVVTGAFAPQREGGFRKTDLAVETDEDGFLPLGAISLHDRPLRIALLADEEGAKAGAGRAHGPVHVVFRNLLIRGVVADSLRPGGSGRVRPAVLSGVVTANS